MYKKDWIFFVGVIGWLVFCQGTGGEVAAQEAIYELGHEDVFGKLQRPTVSFPHDRHMDALEEEGCGVCHHVLDENAGVLVPEDDPDVGCTECHSAEKDGKRPALRQAFHGSCTGCHRKVNQSIQASPPVTCGACHKKRGWAGKEM